MEKFVPYEKLSKKKKKALDAAKRGGWNGLNPVTRKTADARAYRRMKKTQLWDHADPPAVSFFL